MVGQGGPWSVREVHGRSGRSMVGQGGPWSVREVHGRSVRSMVGQGGPWSVSDHGRSGMSTVVRDPYVQSGSVQSVQEMQLNYTSKDRKRIGSECPYLRFT